jgi:hypothetical protein
VTTRGFINSFFTAGGFTVVILVSTVGLSFFVLELQNCNNNNNYSLFVCNNLEMVREDLALAIIIITLEWNDA